MTAALWRRRRRPSAPSGPPSRPPRSPRPPRSRSPRHQESSPFGQEIAASVQRLASTTADLEKLVGRSRWRCRPSRAIGDDRGGPARRPDGMGPTNAGHLILGRDGRTAAARDGRASAPRAAGSPAAGVLMRSGRSEGRSSPALEIRRAGPARWTRRTVPPAPGQDRSNERSSPSTSSAASRSGKRRGRGPAACVRAHRRAHRARTVHKLRLSTRAELVRYALDRGPLEPSA
jgi:hypothetical protein